MAMAIDASRDMTKSLWLSVCRQTNNYDLLIQALQLFKGLGWGYGCYPLFLITDNDSLGMIVGQRGPREAREGHSGPGRPTLKHVPYLRARLAYQISPAR